MPTKSLQKQTGNFKFDWPLTGRYRNDVDPMLIGPDNFQRCDNFRYTADGIRGILGMTKFNASALDLLQIQNGFHFRKDQPSESRVFVQAKTGAASKLYKSNNTAASPLQDTLTSIATLENNNTMFFSQAPQGGMAALNGSANRIWEGLEGRCSAFIVFDPDNGSFWYDYTEKIRNSLTDAQNVATLKTISNVAYIYVGSVRPLQGVKFYVGTANGNTATATAYEWTGTAWTALTITDGTSVGGKTMAVTGSITFASTVSTSKAKIIQKGIAYYYKFVLTGVAATTTVSHCTLDAPMQTITDLWDGTGRECLQAWKSFATQAFSDITMNLAPSTTENSKVYNSSNPDSYADFNIYGINHYANGGFFFGFSERLSGLTVSMPDAGHVNATAGVVSVDYWNGIAWTTVGTVEDSTSSAGHPLSHSGTITWNQISENTEFTTNVANDDKWYYYRLQFSDGTVRDVRVDNIGGITAQKQIKPYRFPVMWQNRLWLFNDQTDKKNVGLCSAYGSNSVFNGSDSAEVEFGDTSELICGDSIFSRYGNSIYDSLVLFKKNAMYLVDGNSPSTWQLFTISDKVGCIAPLTLKRCEMGYEVTQGITKHVLVWRSARGIEFFDGNTVVPISRDIYSYFNPASADYINPVTYDTSIETAFFDEINFEYHWLFTNASGKHELVYNMTLKKWSPFLRGTGKELASGFTVQDTKGNQYSMGGTYDGFVERLEYGTTFDGNAITSTFRNGDVLLMGTGAYSCKMHKLKLFGKTKNTSTVKVTAKHYADTANTAVSLPDIVQTGASTRLYQAKCSVNIDATLHSVEFSITTTNESIGFEPMMITGLFNSIREDF